MFKKKFIYVVSGVKYSYDEVSATSQGAFPECCTVVLLLSTLLPTCLTLFGRLRVARWTRVGYQWEWDSDRVAKACTRKLRA